MTPVRGDREDDGAIVILSCRKYMSSLYDMMIRRARRISNSEVGLLTQVRQRGRTTRIGRKMSIDGVEVDSFGIIGVGPDWKEKAFAKPVGDKVAIQN